MFTQPGLGQINKRQQAALHHSPFQLLLWAQPTWGPFQSLWCYISFPQTCFPVRSEIRTEVQIIRPWQEYSASATEYSTYYKFVVKKCWLYSLAFRHVTEACNTLMFCMNISTQIVILSIIDLCCDCFTKVLLLSLISEHLSLIVYSLIQPCSSYV